ncbi:hypothetical protein RB195_007962 [Necator americanus]|uniref:Uncharacterized protein n=1 Tax=Necator americanus TaxID=51031 RepID=A0ABR1C2C8_NECAM
MTYGASRRVKGRLLSVIQGEISGTTPIGLHSPRPRTASAPPEIRATSDSWSDAFNRLYVCNGKYIC